MAYDKTSKTLRGYILDGTNDAYYAVTIDPTSGVCHKDLELDTLQGGIITCAAYEPISETLLFAEAINGGCNYCLLICSSASNVQLQKQEIHKDQFRASLFH